LGIVLARRDNAPIVKEICSGIINHLLNSNNPQEAIDLGIKGRVTVRFVVEKDGRISNVSVATPLPGCKACDKAAVKVVEKMPSWKAGKNAGREVRTWVTLPVKFEVN
jgi:protein TonB